MAPGDEFRILRRDAWPHYRVAEQGFKGVSFWTLWGAKRFIKRRIATVYWEEIEK